MKGALSTSTWLVAGRRRALRGDETLLASAWGKTESSAREFFRKLQELAERQRLPGGPAGAPWSDAQLTFVRVEEVVS